MNHVTNCSSTIVFNFVLSNSESFQIVIFDLSGRKTISLRNVTNDAWEKLDFRDRIIQVSDKTGAGTTLLAPKQILLAQEWFELQKI